MAPDSDRTQTGFRQKSDRFRPDSDRIQTDSDRFRQNSDSFSQIQNKANADFADFQKEISIAHPGYIFSPSKGLVKEEKEVKPEAKKVIK